MNITDTERCRAKSGVSTVSIHGNVGRFAVDMHNDLEFICPFYDFKPKYNRVFGLRLNNKLNTSLLVIANTAMVLNRICYDLNE